jgi:hypothetical protein
MGVFSFGYFSLDKQRKVTRQAAKRNFKLRKNVGHCCSTYVLLIQPVIQNVNII